MKVITKLHVRWDHLRELLVHEECIQDGMIDYAAFLNDFQVHYGTERDLAYPRPPPD